MSGSVLSPNSLILEKGTLRAANAPGDSIAVQLQSEGWPDGVGETARNVSD